MTCLPIRTMASSEDVALLERRFLLRASSLCLVVRSITYLLAAVATLLQGELAAEGLRWLMPALACWATFRLLSRVPNKTFLLADYTWAVAVGAATPVMASTANISAAISPSFAVLVIAVATTAIELPIRASLPLTFLLAAAYAGIGSGSVRWPGVFRIPDIYVLAAIAGLALLIRWAIGRMSNAILSAQRDRIEAQIASSVAIQRLVMEREHLAVLHDTAAATLLLATEVDGPPKDKLAAQATRDLRILQQPLGQMVPRAEIVEAMRSAALHALTPTAVSGLPSLWLEGSLAVAVESAVREALNNVDRHSGATRAVIDVSNTGVVVYDDGTGVDPMTAGTGYGLSESIVGRMERAGGQAVIESDPGRGTTVRLTWRTEEATPPAHGTVDESDLLIGRVRTTCGLIVLGYALVSLMTTAPWGLVHEAVPAVQSAMALSVVLCTVAALLGFVRQRWAAARGARVVLLAIAVIQPLLLPDSLLRTEAQWTVAAVGFCLVPLLIRTSLSRSVGILLLCWVLPAGIDLLRVPTTQMLAAILAGAACFLAPQVGLAVFTAGSERVARNAHADNFFRSQLLVNEEVANVVRADCERRYADTTQRILPILAELSRGGPVTEDLKRRAARENLRLRRMFEEARTGAQPHLASLRTAIQAAAERGVDVTTRIDPGARDLSAADAGRLVATIAGELEDARSYARIVITTAEASIVGSVVSDGPRIGLDPRRFRDDVEVLESAGGRWVTWRLPIAGERR